jgi:predicted ArsR family transcriptional regulator
MPDPTVTDQTVTDQTAADQTAADQAIVDLTDVAMLRAMAHPLRMRILGSLRIDGPATSAILARRLATDTGQTSHHLRVLARHGFVADAPELGRGARGRERWWKAAHAGTRWSQRLEHLGPGAADALATIDRSARQAWDQIAETYWAQVAQQQWSPAWREVAGCADQLVRTTPEGLAALRTELQRVIAAHALGDAAAEGAATVVVALQAYPCRTAP